MTVAVIIFQLSSGGSNKAAVVIDGGIHAREWITPATVMYLARYVSKIKLTTSIYYSLGK